MANPFRVPMDATIARFSIRPESLADWCARQRWDDDELIGSVSG